MTIAGTMFSILFVVQIASGAQATADFSGVWAPLPGSGSRVVWTINQSNGAITLRESVDDRPIRVTTWGLNDNRPVKSSIAVGRQAETTAIVIGNEIQFRGTTLIANGGIATVKQSWSLDASGTVLTVVKTIESAPGSSLTNTRIFSRVRQ
jgi:hypothetical protein